MRNQTKYLVERAMAIALLVISAQIAVPLPHMIPISLQTLAIYIIAMTFNKNQALIITLIYLFMGAIGLPVFFYWPFLFKLISQACLFIRVIPSL